MATRKTKATPAKTKAKASVKTSLRVLFVCSGNTCRSPMAAGYFADLCAKAGRVDVVVESAGAFASAGSPASTHAAATAAAFGVDLSAHRSQTLTKALLDSADLVFCMGRQHRAAALGLAPDAADKLKLLMEAGGLSGEVPDPYGGGLMEYHACWAMMAQALANILLDS